MLAILTLLLAISISILVTRIGTVALVHTGLPFEMARFQARSAFSGVGFTTSESESVVSHPLRRRIVMILMLLGNAGIVTVISSFILSFVNQGESQSMAPRLLLLTAGLASLWFISHSKWVDRQLSVLIDRFLKRYTSLDVCDYASLMHLAGEYSLVELEVGEGDWISNRTLAETELGAEGIIILGIRRADGTYLGAPHGATPILPQDVLIIYGRVGKIEELDQRRKNKRGDQQHEQAVAEQQRVIEEETKEDPAQQ